jgi:hypothetical protein
MTKLWGALGVLICCGPTSFADDRVRIVLDASEADRVLAILDKRATATPVGDADWQALFSTEPYRRLKERESSMHRDFSDDDFKAFVLSDALLAKRAALAATLTAWKRADLNEAAARTLGYLPASAVVRAKVFAEIKPIDNSFVFDVDRDPTIFLAVSTKMTTERFANTVAHEMHHIGLASADKPYEARIGALAPHAKKAAMWMGAFGEGLAMLAAAGRSDVPPTASEGPEEQRNWQEGMATFDAGFAELQTFFEQVLDGALDGDAADRRAASFFGEIRGPWYFVGYRMAVIVESRFGRAALIACMLDYRELLAKYNEAAETLNRSGSMRLPTWSSAIIDGVSASTPNRD